MDTRDDNNAIPRGKLTYEEAEGLVKEPDASSLMEQIERQTKEKPDAKEPSAVTLESEFQRHATHTNQTASRTSDIIKPIRTFARDLKEAKLRAGIDEPEKKKRKEKQKKEVERVQTPVVLNQPISTPHPQENELSFNIQPEPIISEQEEETLKRQVEESVLTLPSEPEPQFETPEEKPTEPELSIPKETPATKTYHDDIANVLQTKAPSPAHIAETQHEIKKYTPQPKEESPGIKNAFIVMISIILVGFSGLLGWFVLVQNRNNDNLPTIAVSKQPTLIFANAEEEVGVSGLSGDLLLEKLTSVKNEAAGNNGDIVNVAVVDDLFQALNAKRLLERMSDSVPNTLTRLLLPEFMLGIHLDEENEPFLILRTEFFENAFANMIVWENTINADLAPLFGPELSRTTLGGETSIVVPREFNDVVVHNIDTRLLRDDRGNIVLLYAFPNPQTIIITTNENTFLEIIRRLSTSRNASP